MPSNERFPSVFVLNAAADLVRDDTKRPFELALGRTGIFNTATGKGVPDAAAAGSVKSIVFHKNIGNDQTGTYRSGTIFLSNISRWSKHAPQAPVAKRIVVGHNGTDGTICAPCNSQVNFHITVYNRRSIDRYYGDAGYTKIITIDTGCCTGMAPANFIADELVKAINGTETSVDGWPSTSELPNFLTASKTVGTDTDNDIGVRIESKVPATDALNACDPDQWFDLNFVDFEVGMEIIGGCHCPTPTPIRTTQELKMPKGYPLEVASLEKEAYGYNINREHFSHPRFMATNPYRLSAQAGATYIFYHLEFTYTQHKMGVQNGGLQSSVHEVIFAVNSTVTALVTAVEDMITDLTTLTPTSPQGALL